MALAGGVAGWELPFTHTFHTTGDWRAALRSLEAWQAGSCIHWRRSNQLGLESGAACNQDVARWEQPYTADGQSCVVRGRLVSKAVW